MKRVECFECRGTGFCRDDNYKEFYVLFVRAMVKFSLRMMKTNLQMNTAIAMSLAAGLLVMTKTE